jgi:hypothetical protein
MWKYFQQQQQQGQPKPAGIAQILKPKAPPMVVGPPKPKKIPLAPKAAPMTPKAVAKGPPKPGQPGWAASRHYCGGVRGRPLPAGFNEARYLALNPKIAAAYKGRPHAGATHYSCRGWKENRKFAGLERPGYLGGLFSSWS